MKKQKGGVRLSDEYKLANPQGNTTTANVFFMHNSRFRILTNNSVSCITLVATLNEGIESPFRSMRSNNIDIHIRSLLVKVFITNQESGWYSIPSREIYKGIEITSKEDFTKEIERSINIYRLSIISRDSLLDGICPAIISSTTLQSNNELVRNLWQLFNVNDAGLGDILTAALDPNPNGNAISIMTMEFMEGFDTAYNVLNNNINNPTRFTFLMAVVQYEFRRLNILGYLHGDAHLNNVLINPNYQYFTRSGNPEYLGRAIIIDFGRTKTLSPEQLGLVLSGDVSICAAEIQNTILDRSLIRNGLARLPNDNRPILYMSEEINQLQRWRENYINDITIPYLRQRLGLGNDVDVQQYIFNNILPSDYWYHLGGTKNKEKGRKSTLTKLKKTQKNKTSSRKQK
jgi:hypothetical protein